MKIKNSYEYLIEKSKQIKPMLRFNKSEDFGTWQKRAKQKLNELLGLPFQKCDDMFQIIGSTKYEGYEQIEFEFQSEKNYFVNGVLLVPEGIKKALPTMICLQGHSSGKHISLAQPKFNGDERDIAGGRDFAVRAVKEGCCAAVIDQRYMGEMGQNEKGTPACFSSYVALPTLLMGRCAIGERVWDVQRLIDVIIKYFSAYVDVNNIICMGNSGGGTTTFYAACIDERIKMAVPSCAVCSYDASIMAMSHCVCNYIPGIRNYFDMGDIGMLIAPRKLLVVCGKDDPIFPLKGVLESIERIKTAYGIMDVEENCKLVIGGEGHRFYPDDAWPIIHSMIQK